MAASNPRRVGLNEIAMGVLGERGGSFPSGGAAAKRLRVLERRYVLMALKWVQCPERAKARGSTGERSVSLARSVLYYKTHLAFVLNAGLFLKVEN